MMPAAHFAAPSSGRLARVAGALLPLALLLVLVFVDLPVCPTKSFFGVPCPGCGLTRAARLVLTGDFAGAFAMHPLVFVLGPLLGLWLLREAAEALGWARPGTLAIPFRVPGWVYGALVVLLFAVWLTRLAGLFGGHPDGFHPEAGLFARALRTVF